MYRHYENPHTVARMLENARKSLEWAKLNLDPEDLVEYVLDVEELEARLRFAWDDDEAEMFGYD